MVWLRPAPGTVFVARRTRIFRLTSGVPSASASPPSTVWTFRFAPEHLKHSKKSWPTLFTSGPAFWGVKILDRPVATLFTNLSSSASTCYGAVRLKLLSHSLTAPKHNRRLIQQVPSVMRSLQNIPFPKGKSQICRLVQTISGFNQEPGTHGATCKDWKKWEAMRC